VYRSAVIQLPDQLEVMPPGCSRPLIPLRHAFNEPWVFMPLDHAEKLLLTGSPDYNGMSQVECGRRVFLRFGSISTEVVCTPYDHCDWRVHDSVTVPMYIQENMIRPICTLSVDPNDLAYAECDWREFLGSVHVNVIGKETVDVRMDDANRLNCRRTKRLRAPSKLINPTSS